MDNINVSELFTTKMCSPLIAFAVITLLLGVSLYNSRTALKSHNSSKMDNLLNVYSWHEIKLIIIIGVILYGMCQYNQVYLAWVFLFIPVIYLVIKNLMLFLYVSLAHQNAPKQAMQMQNYGVPPAMQQAVQQMAQQQMQEPVNKTIDLSPPMSTNVNNLSGPSNSGMQLPLYQQQQLGGNLAPF